MISQILEDPIIGEALPMEINNDELDEIVDGIRKASRVVEILYHFYKGPEDTPMMAKIVQDIRTAVDIATYIGEVKKNTINKPFILFLFGEINRVGEMKISEFLELMQSTL